MNEFNVLFDKYMEEVKKLNTKEKRDEIINSIKKLIAVIDSLAKSENIELHYLQNKEILDLEKEPVSEDDYLEAVLVYIETAKCLIGEYLENKII